VNLKILEVARNTNAMVSRRFVWISVYQKQIVKLHLSRLLAVAFLLVVAAAEGVVHDAAMGAHLAQAP